MFKLGPVSDQVLGTRIRVVVCAVHTRLSPYLGCADSRSSVVVGVDRVI
jgi:hypothetical protein